MPFVETILEKAHEALIATPDGCAQGRAEEKDLVYLLRGMISVFCHFGLCPAPPQRFHKRTPSMRICTVTLQVTHPLGLVEDEEAMLDGEKDTVLQNKIAQSIIDAPPNCTRTSHPLKSNAIFSAERK
ncbi:hypothetical protein PROFUN_16590, partial [Planoprotostelium fungivorum]